MTKQAPRTYSKEAQRQAARYIEAGTAFLNLPSYEAIRADTQIRDVKTIKRALLSNLIHNSQQMDESAKFLASKRLSKIQT